MVIVQVQYDDRLASLRPLHITLQNNTGIYRQYLEIRRLMPGAASVRGSYALNHQRGSRLLAAQALADDLPLPDVQPSGSRPITDSCLYSWGTGSMPRRCRDVS